MCEACAGERCPRQHPQALGVVDVQYHQDTESNCNDYLK